VFPCLGFTYFRADSFPMNTTNTASLPATAKKSAAYRKGLRNAARAHYWQWQFNRDLDALPTLAAQVDFSNGYHAGLADRYGMARPAAQVVADVANRFALHIYA
jgi:hypothetical protein